MKIIIVYHSGSGHTKIVAEHIAKGALQELDNVLLIPVQEAQAHLHDFEHADAIVFGTPTYFGNVSAEFKKFMEATGGIWYHQLWKNKLAAGFTNSSSRNGDKLNTLMSLSIFAAQHGMMWIPLGVMPQYDEKGWQLEEPNGMASYLGLMTQSDNSTEQLSPPADLATAEIFGRRIASLTIQLKSKETALALN
jgi:NAD(P)H dehydrogenase (quinone)